MLKAVFVKWSGVILVLLILLVVALFLSGQLLKEEVSGMVKDLEASSLKSEAKKILKGLRYIRDTASGQCIMVVFESSQKQPNVIGVCPCDSIPQNLIIEVEDERP